MLSTLKGMRTTINLPPKLLEETKVQAKANNVTLSSYVEEAVRAALKKETRISTEDAPVNLPSFDCGGPALVDLSDKEAVWAVLDDHS